MNFIDQLTSLPTRYLQGNIITIKIFILIVELSKYFLKEVYIHFHYLPIYPFRITVTTLGNISRFSKKSEQLQSSSASTTRDSLILSKPHLHPYILQSGPNQNLIWFNTDGTLYCVLLYLYIHVSVLLLSRFSNSERVVVSREANMMLGIKYGS